MTSTAYSAVLSGIVAHLVEVEVDVVLEAGFAGEAFFDAEGAGDKDGGAADLVEEFGPAPWFTNPWRDWPSWDERLGRRVAGIAAVGPLIFFVRVALTATIEEQKPGHVPTTAPHHHSRLRRCRRL